MNNIFRQASQVRHRLLELLSVPTRVTTETLQGIVMVSGCCFQLPCVPSIVNRAVRASFYDSYLKCFAMSADVDIFTYHVCSDRCAPMVSGH